MLSHDYVLLTISRLPLSVQRPFFHFEKTILKT
ncbi:MAG: hypothetical protein ACI9XP_001268, partial [Lentimonas sp.]